MDNYLLFGAGKRLKKWVPNTDIHNERSATVRWRPGGRDVFFFTAPPVPVRAAGHLMEYGDGQGRCYKWRSTWAVMFKGPNIRVTVPDSSENERAKREQYSRLMPELKAQLRQKGSGFVRLKPIW